MRIKQIVEDIIEKRGKDGIDSVVFAACGGSFATLFPAKYILELNSRTLRVGHYSSNELLHAKPAYVTDKTIIVSISHNGNTRETIEVAKMAQSIGAVSVTLTFKPESPLAQAGDYVITYDWDPEYQDQKESNVVVAMRLAMEILNQFEGYEYYDEFNDACNKLTDVIEKAKAVVDKGKYDFAEKYKNSKGIYVLGSGYAAYSAYAFTICLLLEMQWMNANAIHSGEFFHGPFEITDKDTDFILLKSAGMTRPLDQRAQNFLDKYNGKEFIIDAEELGLPELGEHVHTMFNQIFYAVILRRYAEALAEVREHDLGIRRYMWKVEY